jgi:hypothetical protein
MGRVRCDIINQVRLNFYSVEIEDFVVLGVDIVNSNFIAVNNFALSEDRRSVTRKGK